MIQRTFTADNTDEIEQIAAEIKAEPLYGRSRDRLIIIWSELWDREDVRNFYGWAVSLFYDCHVVGMSYNNRKNVLNDVGHEGNIQITAMLFESSEISVFTRKEDDAPESEYGKKLNSYLEGITDIKGVLIVTPRYFFSVDPMLNEAVRGYEDIPFFGIKTTINPAFMTCYCAPEDTEAAYGVFMAVIFRGKDLNIRTGYSLGWIPMGKTMTITEIENPFVINKIDDHPASEIYKRYLGLEEKQIQPMNICEFPIVLHKDNRIVARIGMLGPMPGQLVFGIPCKEGEVLQISYGDPEEIYESAFRDSVEMRQFDPEAELLFVCVNRLLLLKDEENKEVDCFKNEFADAAVLYGYAEILHDKIGGGEMNSAFISVAFREGDTKQCPETLEVKSERIKTDKDGIVPLEYRMFSFFKEMSKDLIKSAEEAYKANRAKTEFLSSVSHEIRTPINAILGMDEMILRESTQDEVRKYAGNIRESGKLLLGLINDLLDTARIESGKLSIIPVKYDLSAALLDLVNIGGIRAEAKGLDFVTNIDPLLPCSLIGDETRVKQCALNILNNAVKYTPSGQVTLTVSHEKKDDSHILLKISVTDTGIGIKEKDLGKLFSPFERIEESRNYTVEGAGLGLNIVHNLLKMMGSSLKVSSEYGKGSVFSFEVEQEVASWKEMGDFVISKSESTREKDTYSASFKAPDAKLLVVDDTEMNLVVIKALLKETEINIDTATGGREALEMIREKKYDLIFLDKQMPEMDGVQVFHSMRSDLSHKNTRTPCIVLTADATYGMREELLKEGFDDYVSKPVEPEELEQVIRKHLPTDKMPGYRKIGGSSSSFGKADKTDQGTQANDQSEMPETVKKVSGIDFAVALKNCGDEENLMEIMRSFLGMAEGTEDALIKHEEEKDLENFTIKAHALKSSAAIIGAGYLSDEAKKLEKYGHDGEYYRIHDALPGFLENYRELVKEVELFLHSFGETVIDFDDEEEMTDSNKGVKKTLIKKNDFLSSLRRITDMVEEFDYEGALFSLQILEKFDLAENKKDILKVEELLKNFDGEDALELLNDLMGRV